MPTKGRERAVQLDAIILKLVVALGIGLLIGAERERRKGEGATRGSAGLRTFALAALAGGVARALGGELLLAVVVAVAAAFAAASYLRSRADDPGLTTEVALVLTVLLGALAGDQPALAAGSGVIVVVLLAARSPLHRFVDAVLTKEEGRDGLILAAIAFVIWPLLPREAIGPFAALNLRAVCQVVILVMVIGALGHAAERWLGARFGLPLAGFASGFVSSAATIGAMGGRVAANPTLLASAVAGAVLSTVATIIQLGLLLTAVDARVMRVMAGPLICAGLAAIAYASIFTLIALKDASEDVRIPGRAFSLTGALAFGALLSVVSVGAAALAHWFGGSGVIAGVFLAGFVDAHAPSVSVASLTAAGALPVCEAATPILAAMSANTVTKILLAFGSGSHGFALRVTPGLLAVIAAAWVGVRLASF